MQKNNLARKTGSYIIGYTSPHSKVAERLLETATLREMINNETNFSTSTVNNSFMWQAH